jgi:hypothetical protein
MTPLDYIPFVNSEYDCQAVSRYYADAVAMRISLESIEKFRSNIPIGPKRWIDASVDGLHHKDLSKLSDNYRSHVTKFDGYRDIANPEFQNSPDRLTVHKFTISVLDACKKENPDWLSIPQLPIINGVGRNKINRLLAEAALKWKSSRGYSGALILPAIFTHQNQINKKTERNKKIASISTCFAVAAASGVWVADSSLNDQEGSGTFESRFPSLRKLHEELDQKIPGKRLTIGGPYWGMNLVLWARGCVDYPAIGLGGSYKYNIPGQKLPKGKVRVALKPLRRWGIASPNLRAWLLKTISSLSNDDRVKADFVVLERDLAKLQAQPNGKLQIAGFYKEWFDRFSSLPQAGRALALFQDLSSSYVLGKTLDPLPKEEGTSRRPERVAQQLMLNCL